MSQEIDLVDFIHQVKTELLARRPAQEAKGLPRLFWIDQIELELSVSVTSEASGGVKLSIIPVGAEISGSRAQERGHTVKVRLTPLITREEMRDLLSQDPDFQETLAQTLRTLIREA